MTPKTISLIHELLTERKNAAQEAYTKAQELRAEFCERGDERLLERTKSASEKAKAEYDKFRDALHEFESATITIQ